MRAMTDSEIMDLFEAQGEAIKTLQIKVGELQQQLNQAKRASIKSANDASCLANGVLPD